MSNSKIRTLIVDDNKEFSSILSEYLGSEEDFEVIGTASDGIEALDLIQKEPPDLLLLDIIMPHLDGLGVLEKIQSMNLNRKLIIVLISAIGHDNITRRAIQMGADYYVVKPFDINIFAGRLKELFFTAAKTLLDDTESNVYGIRDTDTIDIEVEASSLLHEFGVPANVKGYLYLRDAIMMVIDNVELLSGVTKELYPSIADKYNTTSSRVERAIRHAIEVASERSKANMSKSPTLFSSTFPSHINKPSNSEFIAVLSDSIRLKIKSRG